MRPPSSRPRHRSRDASEHPARARSRVRMQDLTAEQVRDWLDSACMDVVPSDDQRDVAVRVDETRIRVRVIPQRGELLVSVDFAFRSDADDDDVDRSMWLEAINRANMRAMYVRCVLCSDGQDTWLRVEHEHFGCDGGITRRQLVKLIRAVTLRARDLHRWIWTDVRRG